MQLLENPACDRRCLSGIPAHVFGPRTVLFQWLKRPRKALPGRQKTLPARTAILSPLPPVYLLRGVDYHRPSLRKGGPRNYFSGLIDQG